VDDGSRVTAGGAGDDGVDLDEDTDSTPDAGLQTEDSQDPAKVVLYSNRVVSEYLSKHPEDAQAVLAAEIDRARNADEEPRRGVVRAVQAVSGRSE
jgi:hypothetical protein